MWQRQYQLEVQSFEVSHERWTRSIDPVEVLDLTVRFGKHLDVATLRGTGTEEQVQASDIVASEVASLYSNANLTEVEHCPACGSLWRTKDSFPIHGIEYATCSACGHATVMRQPPEEVMRQQFIQSASLASPYTNREVTEFRIEEIAIPKLEWILEQFSKLSGGVPRKVLDVGAGAGHFVEACRRQAIDAEGIELSQDARRFAQDLFGFDLKTEDFLESKTHYSDIDVVTMWGLLEYVSQPYDFLRKAGSILSPHGIVVVEVPRIDSLSSWVQRSFPDRVSRHLDPASHLNCFSDSSLMEILFRSNLRPVSLWYFGMDLYELLVQIQLASGQPNIMNSLSPALNTIQHGFDRHLFSDDVIVMATPA